MSRWLWTVGICALSAAAQAADLKITEIKARLYMEATGTFSDPLGPDADLQNLAKGDGPSHRLASGVLIELTFAGDKNSSPKYATATVDVSQTDHSGRAVVTHKGFTNFVFGPEGVEHRAFLLENATCMPLQIDVHANKTAKSLRLPFACKS